jgi:hypothetical protein
MSNPPLKPPTMLFLPKAIQPSNCSGLLAVNCWAEPRLDGSSKEAFEKSMAKVQATMTPEQMMELFKATMVIFGDVMSAEKININTTSTKEQEAAVKKYYKRLDKKTATEIIQEAEKLGM